MTSSQEIDRRLFEQIRDKLFTSIISDALDSAGFRNQAMLSKIRPIDDALILVGRARTASFMEVWHHDEGTNPYELEIKLVDSLMPFEIPIFACSNSARIGPWGNYCLQRHKPVAQLELSWMDAPEMSVQFVP